MNAIVTITAHSRCDDPSVDASSACTHDCCRMDYQKQFGNTVRRLRGNQGWSQEDLAEFSGLHRTYISGIERGVRNPSLSIIIQVAKALKVHPSLLFSEKVEDEKQERIQHQRRA